MPVPVETWPQHEILTNIRIGITISSPDELIAQHTRYTWILE